jgi:hypothetical protein
METKSEPGTAEIADARRFLLEITAPRFATYSELLAELVRLGEEGAELLTRPDGAAPPAEVAEHCRRRAFLLVHAAERHPELADVAHRAVLLWRRAASAEAAAVLGR